MNMRGRRGLHVVEYAILLAAVIATLSLIMTYLGRSIKARVIGGSDAYTGISIPGGATGIGTNAIASKKQEEPYYNNQNYKNYTEQVEQDHMGNNRVQKEIVSNVNARSGSQKQMGMKGKTDSDKLWTATGN